MIKRKPRIIVENNPNDLARRGADIFAATAQDAVKGAGRFMVAISGGATPRSMHRLFAEEPYTSKIPWDKTCLFWVDERCVPENDEASNYGAAKRDFIERVPIPDEHVHPMPAEALPEKGAETYQKILQTSFHLNEGDLPVFDLIFLGIGTDGHTASMFPGQKALEERERLVVALKGGAPKVNRLTLTYPVLNASEQVIFLVSGKGKAEILKRIFEGQRGLLPAQQVNPTSGGIHWLLDRDAASLLPMEKIHDH
jgi:6-phosphogluconolactonase